MIALKLASIFQILIGLLMVVYHLATLYPWYAYSMAVYATHNVFLVFADVFLIGLGIFGLLVSFEVGSLKDKGKSTSFLLTGGTLFGIPTIIFLVSSQGAIEYSLWNLYQNVLPYKLKTLMSTSSVTTTMVDTFTYLDPTFAFIFTFILFIVWIISLIGSISFLKSENSALFDGTGSPLRSVNSVSTVSTSNLDNSDKVSTVSYVAYSSNQ